MFLFRSLFLSLYLIDTQSHAVHLSVFITYQVLQYKLLLAIFRTKVERKKIFTLFLATFSPILFNSSTSNTQQIADWPRPSKAYNGYTCQKQKKKKIGDNKYIKRSNSIWLIESWFRNGSSFAEPYCVYTYTVCMPSKKEKNIKNI